MVFILYLVLGVGIFWLLSSWCSLREKTDKYTIEHYTTTNKYIVKCNGSPLQRNPQTGEIGVTDGIFYSRASVFDAKQEAEEFIEEHKRQQIEGIKRVYDYE